MQSCCGGLRARLCSRERVWEYLELRCGTLDEVDRQGALRPDLVLANLDRQTLLLLCDALAQYVSHGARLLLSGILLDQEQEIIEAFSKVGAMLCQRREQEGWVALELLLAESCEGVEKSMTRMGRPPYPHLCQINVSDGGVPKRPVLEAVITKAGVEGDRQQNLKFHGGPDRAVCLYSQELIERLQDEGHSIEAGSSGENLWRVPRLPRPRPIGPARSAGCQPPAFEFVGAGR